MKLEELKFFMGAVWRCAREVYAVRKEGPGRERREMSGGSRR